MDTHLGFGRGSAVREYWLMRCQGFSVVRADGRRLGRVKRVETHMEGILLRLTGLRARTVPLSAVDTVWPGASVLVISDEPIGERSEGSVGRAQTDRRPAWTEDNVPWWDLVEDEPPEAREHANATSPRAGPRSPRFPLAAPRLRTSALPRRSVEPFAKAFAARTTDLVERAQNLARTLARQAIRVSRTTVEALDGARLTAQGRLLTTTRRIRLRIARLLLRTAVWVGGTNAFAAGASQDNRLELDESDTEEIDTGSRLA
jgi:hypothetical protein